MAMTSTGSRRGL